MKPRLQALSMTKEDIAIWETIDYSRAGQYHAWTHQDRRDAGLMLFASSQRLYDWSEERGVWIAPFVHCMVKIDPEWPIGHYIINFA